MRTAIGIGEVLKVDVGEMVRAEVKKLLRADTKRILETAIAIMDENEFTRATDWKCLQNLLLTGLDSWK